MRFSLISWSSLIFSCVNTLVSSTEFTGFSIYSSTSRWTAPLAYSNSSNPVKNRIFVAGYSALIRRDNSKPSIKGIRISVMTTSGWHSSISSNAFTPLLACPATQNPSPSQLIFFMITWITSSSSSTRSTE